MAVVALRKDGEEILVDNETQREMHDGLVSEGWREGGAEATEPEAKPEGKKGKKSS